MTAVERLDIPAEVARLTAALEERADPAYEAGMRRTVPSQQPAHAVRVPDIRRVAAQWLRGHPSAAPADLALLADALWSTGWREERIIAMAILARGARLHPVDWDTVLRWSSEMDNWEHVDNMASILTGPMLGRHPDAVTGIRGLASSSHVWQRRLAVVTMIEAARDDPAWLPDLKAVTQELKGDRGPTMRKAVDWARRTILKIEANGG